MGDMWHFVPGIEGKILVMLELVMQAFISAVLYIWHRQMCQRAGRQTRFLQGCVLRLLKGC